MYFDTKSYLKNTRNHTSKYTLTNPTVQRLLHSAEENVYVSILHRIWQLVASLVVTTEKFPLPQIK